MIEFGALLGFLGLLGVALLILIYLLKPNYQQKIISSSYVWKQSLKYKKKRLPINRMRNIIIIICQILIISIGSFILAQPFLPSTVERQNQDKIAIIDASASMMAYQDNGSTRFENAVSQVRTLGEGVIDKQGRISVIVAGESATLEIQTDAKQDLNLALDKLVDPNYTACSFGDADIDGAMIFAESVLVDNPKADVLFYTATDYKNNDDSVEVVNVSSDEWNVAIFNCRMAFQANYYVFYADVASYNGSDDDIVINCRVTNPNGEIDELVETATARCRGDNPDTVTFEMKVYSFEKVEFFVDVVDSFSYDNRVTLFGGEKEKIKILYYSSAQNSFFSSIPMSYVEVFTDWDIEIVEKTTIDKNVEFIGYDFYIFEHKMPPILPDDGIVLLVNPDTAPDMSGIALGEKIRTQSGYFKLDKAQPSPITTYADIDKIIVSEYTPIVSYNDYTPLLYCNGDPVFLIRDEVDLKVMVLSFSVNMSDISQDPAFPIMMGAAFNYFLPTVVSQHLYDVGQKITISNTIGQTISASGAGIDQTFDKALDQIPCSFTPTVPGEILLKQSFLRRDFEERIYVKISALQSNFSRSADLISPFTPEQKPLLDLDLLIYFAIAMVAFAFIERWLQSRDQA